MKAHDTKVTLKDVDYVCIYVMLESLLGHVCRTLFSW